jgi:hypothetical protein
VHYGEGDDVTWPVASSRKMVIEYRVISSVSGYPREVSSDLRVGIK